MDLVIVESPTKARTLSKFLGKGFDVAASMGHVVDLPKNKLGVEVDHDFKPTYTPTQKSKTIIKILKEKYNKAGVVWLSTDPDREGEAIAWHIQQVLAPDDSKLIRQPADQNSKLTSESSISNSARFRRAVFHEITKEAVEEAFKNPRGLDLNLVNSQQARRVLDRLVGYKLSPLLWKKIRYGLSAGRVQSVAVRLIVERERERVNFKPEEYWLIEGNFTTEKSDAFKASLFEIDGKKATLTNREETDAVLKKLKGCAYSITSVDSVERRKNPYPPFTTSTLQQTAGNRLDFSASRVMKAAQALYENGLITYMRTDSTNLAATAVSQIRDLIKSEYGSEFLPQGARIYKTKSRLAQEAHEAIRPTNVASKVKDLGLKGDGARIYELVWQRAVSCQMKESLFEQTTVIVKGSSPDETNFSFKSTGSVLKFEGWLKVFGSPEDKEADSILPKLSPREKVVLKALTPSQHFTEPPPRFTESSLIKALEDMGIGRPSTYAPTVNTIIMRGYVSREGRALYPNEVGVVVNDLLVEHFPAIVDFGFTAEVEESLDEIAEGKMEWVPVIREFFVPFEKLLKKKEKEIKKEDVTTLEATSEKCPECGRPVVVKLGKFGKFLSCTGFPECKFAKPVEEPAAATLSEDDRKRDVGARFNNSQLGKCPEDQGDLVIKQGRFGKFIACSNYPQCKFTKPYLEKIGVACPECHEGEVIVKRSGRGKVFFGCSRYPECKFASWDRPATADK